MEKRTILAIVLSAAVWIAWYTFFSPDPQTPPPEKAPVAEMEKPDTSANESSSGKDAVEEKAVTVQPVISNNIPAPEKEEAVTIENENYRFTLSNMGATVTGAHQLERDMELVVPGPNGEETPLDFALHFNDQEFLSGNDLSSRLWNHKVEGKTVVFETVYSDSGTPLKIEKIYSFPEGGNSFSVSYRVTNLGEDTFSPQNGVLIASPGEMLGPELDYTNHYNTLKVIRSVNDDYDQVGKGGGFFSKGGPLNKEEGATEWFGIMSRYFLVIMIPQDFQGTGHIADSRKDHTFRSGMYMAMSKLSPGENEEKSFTVYLGEKNKDMLEEVNEDIVPAADISTWIEPIRYFVIWSLMKLNSLFGNLGWSLVVFSIITKMVFLPLTTKSTESMKKMQELTPELNKLKEKYKDKPDQLQKEMMKLYKENNVNPMGGCFPLLLQMPFFFALYSALINSIDLWNAPFIFWIQDLSMPDTVAMIGTFKVNILPVIMTGTTFLQQKLTTVDTGQQQKMMMMMMPVILIFIFWSMPSGLVLYWTLQNTFQVLHQVFINKRAAAKKTA